MKNGDKLISKINFNTLEDGKLLTKDNSYTIFNCDKCGITTDIDEKYFPRNILYFSWILDDEDNKGNGTTYIYDYFYTPEEIRLKKLESL